MRDYLTSYFTLAVTAMAAATILVVAPGAALAQEEECFDCHDVGGDAGEEFVVDAAAWGSSVHVDMGCDMCHTGTDDFPHEDEVEHSPCVECHDDVAEIYAESIHGYARYNGRKEAPDCDACHGNSHSILPATDENSLVHPKRLPDTCAVCHSDPETVKKFGILVARPVEAYRDSVHARGVAEESGAATCSDCHNSHAIFRGPDPRSSVHHEQVPETCGKCHKEIDQAYRASVHGEAAANGVREAPICTDCHGEHRILSPQEKGSPVYATNVPKMTCGRCHNDLRLTEKYDIDDDAVSAYEDSYHGLAARSGLPTVANCASCHGVHDILPSSDRRSHIHPENLAATCGNCHPGAGERFAIGEVHVLPTEPEHFIIYWVRLIYLWMIYVTIGGMLVHNFADFSRKLAHPQSRPEEPGGEIPVRMSLGFRIAHMTLMISFGLLAYTGFALKYPESWWAAPLLVWGDTMDLRGLLHRIAAVAMLGALAFHIVHLVVDRSARRCIANMIPTREDIHEFVERVKYFRGKRTHPPHSGVLGYPEKLEYLALMWGIFVMAVTGFALWYENLALAWMPKWVSDVATVIHFYEAILASLAILVWHFYFVIFDPMVYPMDRTWLTGHAPITRRIERGELHEEETEHRVHADDLAKHELPRFR